MYSNFEIDKALRSLTILVDTREHETKELRKRLTELGAPYRRKKLDFGDYSAEVILPSGETRELSDKVCIERKMNLDELCGCFTIGRGRFEREFTRAKDAGAKVYLLVERADWEKLLSGTYRSRMNPDALSASVLAWCARYGLVPMFCNPEITGRMIGKILRYEAKVLLENGEI